METIKNLYERTIKDQENLISRLKDWIDHERFEKEELRKELMSALIEIDQLKGGLGRKPLPTPISE